MNIYGCSHSVVVASPRTRVIANAVWASPSRIGAAVSLSKRRRERVLATLAFVMMIAAWDATLRLDEQVAPPRMRLSRAVEHENEEQSQGLRF